MQLCCVFGWLGHFFLSQKHIYCNYRCEDFFIYTRKKQKDAPASSQRHAVSVTIDLLGMTQMQDSEVCKQKGVYLQHQVRFVHIYSERVDRVPGVPREGPELGDSPWSLTHLVGSSKVCTKEKENTGKIRP